MRFAIAAVALLAACALVDPASDESVSVAATAGRAVAFLAIGVILRLLYLRKHEGDLYGPEPLWIGAALAAVTVAGHLVSSA
jgi:hypothetical protein